MNIFFLDQNPNLAAQYHCDKVALYKWTTEMYLLALILWRIDNEICSF